MIFIFSSARSGSTWLGKIFDSHPDVLYLHEPDIIDRGLDLLPFWFESDPKPAQIRAAREYLDRLVTARSLRATGTYPFFRKRYRGRFGENVRRSLIYAAKTSEHVGLSRYSNFMRIPDFANGTSVIVPVLKSVSALGRANALIQAGGRDLQSVLLLRHPCGYVNSMLRGQAMGIIERRGSLGRLLNTAAARELDVNRSVLSAADNIETLTWEWLLSNIEAYAAIRAGGGTTVLFDTLVQNACSEVRRLFEKVGLTWGSQNESFLSTMGRKEGSYYSVFREDSVRAASRWQKELTPDTIARVRTIVTRGTIGRMFFPYDVN